jgi:3-hydroxyisobutyrate dehydrogenase-like beta-hydroxyacid dehydrogenase
MSAERLGDMEMTAPTPDLPRVAVLGTGKMGSAIAGRLADSGFTITLWNRTRSRAEALGIGQVADTPVAAVREADVVISNLTGPDAVTSTYLGPGGALEAGDRKLFIEMSTAGADLVPWLATKVEAAGGRLVDAPIVGVPPILRQGKAAILIGGAEGDVAAATSVLKAFGTVRHVGPLGGGARLKLVANSMLADVILAAAELQVAGERSGLRPDDVFWVLQRMAPLLEARRHGYIEDRHEPTLFAVRDLRKDLDLAVELFGQSGVEVPLTSDARTLVATVATADGDQDISAVIRPYRQVERPIAEALPAASSAAAMPR